MAVPAASSIEARAASTTARPTSRVILDLTTPAEQLVKLPLAVGVVVLCCACVVIWERWTSIWIDMTLVLAGLLCIKLGLAMMRATDCYYIVDAGQRQIIYHRKILDELQLEPWAEFADVVRLELV